MEGRTAALIHPIVMGSLFVTTLWAGYLGWQWRRIRTIQNEINELKKQVKPVAVAPDGTPASDSLPSPIEAQIQKLTEVVSALFLFLFIFNFKSKGWYCENYTMLPQEHGALYY